MSNFHIWYVVAPALLLISGVLGYDYSAHEDEALLRQRHAKASPTRRWLNQLYAVAGKPDCLAEGITFLATAIFSVLFIVESFDDLRAISSTLITTYVGSDDVLAVLMMALLALAAFLVVVWAAFYVGRSLESHIARRKFSIFYAAEETVQVEDRMPIQYDPTPAPIEFELSPAMSSADPEIYVQAMAEETAAVVRIFQESSERLRALEQARKSR